MRCAECRDAIQAFVDDELLPEEQRDVREHLASCADCRREHDVVVATTRTLKEGLVRHRAPDVLKARIRGALARPDALEPVLPPRRSCVGTHGARIGRSACPCPSPCRLHRHPDGNDAEIGRRATGPGGRRCGITQRSTAIDPGRPREPSVVESLTPGMPMQPASAATAAVSAALGDSSG